MKREVQYSEHKMTIIQSGQRKDRIASWAAIENGMIPFAAYTTAGAF